MCGTLLLSFFMAMLTSSTAHFRFVCPRPHSPNTLIKTGPCGGYGSSADPRDLVEVTPGPMTLKLEDTLSHKNSPVRVILVERGNSNKHCLLLDQIPKNSKAITPSTPMCGYGSSRYPIGHCEGSFTYVTVMIPDIVCNDCMISAASVMVDFGNRNVDCKGIGIARFDTCPGYNTCTNIKIRHTTAGASRTLDSCSNYTANWVPGNTWPYTVDADPQKYRTNIYGWRYNHEIPYTKSGFLSGSPFVGANAQYPWVAEPAGVCAPEEFKCYGELRSGSNLVMVVSLSQLDSRLHITAVSLGGGELVLNLDATNVYRSSDRVWDTTREVASDLLKKLGSFQASYTVQGSTQHINVTCAATAAVTRVYNSQYKLVGLATVSLVTRRLSLGMTLSYAFSENVAVSVRGPARSSETGALIASESTSKTQGSISVNTLSIELAHALYRGWLYLTANAHRAQLKPPALKGLHRSLAAEVLENGVSHDSGAQSVPPYGLAVLTEAGGNLYARVTMSRMGSEMVSELRIEDTTGTVKLTLPQQQVMTSPRDSTLQEAHMMAPVTDSTVLDGLLDCSLSVRVRTQSARSFMPLKQTTVCSVSATTTTPQPTTTMPTVSTTKAASTSSQLPTSGVPSSTQHSTTASAPPHTPPQAMPPSAPSQSTSAPALPPYTGNAPLGGNTPGLTSAAHRILSSCVVFCTVVALMWKL